MPVITVPDEAQNVFFPVRPLEVAQAISQGLGRSALALITELNVEGMKIIRYSFAHLMAMAVKQRYQQTRNHRTVFSQRGVRRKFHNMAFANI